MLPVVPRRTFCPRRTLQYPWLRTLRRAPPLHPPNRGQTKPEKFQLAGGEMQTQMMQQRFDQGRAQFLTLSTTVRDAKLECRTIKLP